MITVMDDNYENLLTEASLKTLIDEEIDSWKENESENEKAKYREYLQSAAKALKELANYIEREIEHHEVERRHHGQHKTISS